MKKQFAQTLTASLEEFFKLIEQKYNIEFEKIKNSWNEFNQDCIKKDNLYCIHEFTRKPKKGEICNVKIKEGEYCSKHKKKFDKDKNKEDKLDEKYKKKLKPKKLQLIVILNHKVGKFVHPNTRLVFYSKEHKVVYGKLSLDDKIIPLCDKDIDICKKYLFRYDTSLINKDF